MGSKTYLKMKLRINRYGWNHVLSEGYWLTDLPGSAKVYMKVHYRDKPILIIDVVAPGPIILQFPFFIKKGSWFKIEGPQRWRNVGNI